MALSSWRSMVLLGMHEWSGKLQVWTSTLWYPSSIFSYTLHFVTNFGVHLCTDGFSQGTRWSCIHEGWSNIFQIFQKNQRLYPTMVLLSTNAWHKLHHSPSWLFEYHYQKVFFCECGTPEGGCYLLLGLWVNAKHLQRILFMRNPHNLERVVVPYGCLLLPTINLPQPSILICEG